MIHYSYYIYKHMEQLENELRQQAQILGDLNLELNKVSSIP